MNELIEEDKNIIASANYSTIRDYSLVLASQQIVHDVIPTEEGLLKFGFQRMRQNCTKTNSTLSMRKSSSSK